MLAALLEQLTLKVSRVVLGMTVIQSQGIARNSIAARFEAWRLPRPYRLCPASFAARERDLSRHFVSKLTAASDVNASSSDALVNWTRFVEEEEADRRRRQTYLDELSHQQRAAVEADARVVRVVAGPGSGKTRVLIARVARLLDDGIPAGNILLLTFTNKAAKELTSRLRALFGWQRLSGLWSGTFHSTALKILQNYVHKLGDGRRSKFIILDEDESEAITLECLMQHYGSPIQSDDADAVKKAKRAQARALRKELRLKSKVISSNIALVKERLPTVQGLSGADVFQKHNALGDGFIPEGDFIFTYDAYKKRLVELNAFDFGDLLSCAVWLLTNDSKIQHEYRSKFRYIFVDEMQDTNTPQYEFLRRLTKDDADQNSNRLFAVGDPNQSIYAFRGARIMNMMRDMEHDFGRSLETLLLLDNFRSLTPIVRVAENMLKVYLRQPMYQEMVTQRQPSLDTNVIFQLLSGPLEEAKFVTNKIQKLLDSCYCELNDIAILYRRHRISSLFERQLVAAGIPCWVRGNSFWKLREVKDVLGYLRFIADPSDVSAFDRIYNTPSRNIGEVSYSNLQIWCDKEDKKFPEGLVMDLLDVRTTSTTLEEVDIPELEFPKSTKIPKRGRHGLHQLRQIFVFLRTIAASGTVEDTIEALMGECGYEAYLNPDSVIDANIQNRLSNVDALIDIDRQLVDEDRKRLMGLEALMLFSQQAAILTDEESRRDKDGVQLMTIHAAKGLEFKVIFIVACEEGIIPGFQDFDLDLEEEARVMFVALTRAKDILVITCVQERLLNGQWTRPRPSRFIPLTSDYLDRNFETMDIRYS